MYIGNRIIEKENENDSSTYIASSCIKINLVPKLISYMSPYIMIKYNGKWKSFWIGVGHEGWGKSDDSSDVSTFACGTSFFKTLYESKAYKSSIRFISNIHEEDGLNYFYWIDSRNRVFLEVTPEKIDRIPLLECK